MEGMKALCRWRGGPWIPVVLVALLFLLVVGSSDGADIALLLTIPGTLWVLIAWWRKIGLSLIVQGLALAAIAFLAGLQFYQRGFVSEIAYFLLAGMTAPSFGAATGLVRVYGCGSGAFTASRIFRRDR